MSAWTRRSRRMPAYTVLKTPTWLTAITRSYSTGSIVRSVPWTGATPALATTTSRRPQRSTTSATAAAMAARSVTSATTLKAPSAHSARSTAATVAPRAASARVTARPMPCRGAGDEGDAAGDVELHAGESS